MLNLDDAGEITDLDKKQVATSIEKLPDQVEQAWTESSAISFPENYTGVKNIIIAGMGGSALGPELARSILTDKITLPLVIVRDYKLPAFADENTLVILSSYSGTTEEVLSCAQGAVSRNCKIAGITEGSDLGHWLKKGGYPTYIFEAKNNPSEQPRAGLGYMAVGIVGILHSLGFVKISSRHIEDATGSIRGLGEDFHPDSKISNNFAKEIASKLQGFEVSILAAEFLSANAHIFANQINETAKTFSSYHLLSELNHHLLEGLGRPENLSQNLKFVILESDLYSDKIKKRIEITKDILDKHKFDVISVKFEEETPIVQALDTLLVSSWTSFYLGLLNGVDLSEIPWVDYFKKRLAE